MIETIKIYNQNRRLEFGIEKCAMLVMKSSKREITEGIALQNQEKCLEKRRITSTQEYWKRTRRLRKT